MSDVVEVSVVDVLKLSSVMPVPVLEKSSLSGIVLTGAVCTTGLNLTDWLVGLFRACGSGKLKFRTKSVMSSRLPLVKVL